MKHSFWETASPPNRGRSRSHSLKPMCCSLLWSSSSCCVHSWWNNMQQHNNVANTTADDTMNKHRSCTICTLNARIHKCKVHIHSHARLGQRTWALITQTVLGHSAITSPACVGRYQVTSLQISTWRCLQTELVQHLHWDWRWLTRGPAALNRTDISPTTPPTPIVAAAGLLTAWAFLVRGTTRRPPASTTSSLSCNSPCLTTCQQ